MIRNLSKREKTLLYILLLLLIIAGGYYLLIAPSLTYYEELGDDLATLEEQQAEIAGVIQGQAALAQKKAELEQARAAGWRQLKRVLANDELDHLLTGLLLEYGLQPLSLAIADPAYQEIPAFGAALAEEGQNQEGGVQEPEAGGPALTVNYTDISCVGRLEDLLRLLDRLDQETWLSLVAFQADLSQNADFDTAELVLTTEAVEKAYGAADLTASYQYQLRLAAYMTRQDEPAGV